MNLEPKPIRSRVGLPVLGSPAVASTSSAETEIGYYDIPFLKPPTWGWHIATYFFLEAVSSGTFLMAALADIVSRGRYPRVRQLGHYLSFAAFLPCPPLLVADLGRPERFHHMLRIFKPTSPMSHGSWALLAYGLPMSFLAAEQALRDVPGLPDSARRAGRVLPIHVVGTLGIPCALTLATYPGVLLSTTANPLWSRTRLLGALFAAGSVHAGASAVSVALALRGDHTDESARIERIERIAALAEASLLGAVLVSAGHEGRALTTGQHRKWFWIGAVGVGFAVPMLLRAIAPRMGTANRVMRAIGSAAALVGAFALKWAVVGAGRRAALDARPSDRTDWAD